MKVKDLIEILKGLDPELDVYSYDEEGDFTAVQKDGMATDSAVVLIHGGYP